MHFSAALLLSLFPLSTLAAPSTQDTRELLPTGQTVKQDVINIHNAVLALDTTVQSYEGAPFPTSLVEGTPVLSGVAEIHRVNRAGFRHALAALPFSVEDSNDVIDTVVATGKIFSQKQRKISKITEPANKFFHQVNESIPAATQHLKQKEPEFREGALSAVVIASLALLLYDHDTFSAATLAKVNLGIGEAKIKEGTEAVANIHNAIQDAIVFYTANAV